MQDLFPYTCKKTTVQTLFNLCMTFVQAGAVVAVGDEVGVGGRMSSYFP